MRSSNRRGFKERSGGTGRAAAARRRPGRGLRASFRWVGLALLACVALEPFAARADEKLEEPGRLAAVQRRKFRLDHEIFAAASVLPLDAFYKGVGPSASYTLHLGDVWGWEIVRAHYSFNYATGLRDQLHKDFGVAPTAFEELQWMVGSAAVFRPLYGKLALLNRSVVHAELHGTAGATVARFTKTTQAGPQVGLGLRIFLGPSLSLRVEPRYHALFARGSLTNVLEVTGGLALNLGGGD